MSHNGATCLIAWFPDHFVVGHLLMMLHPLVHCFQTIACYEHSAADWLPLNMTVNVPWITALGWTTFSHLWLVSAQMTCDMRLSFNLFCIVRLVWCLTASELAYQSFALLWISTLIIQLYS